MLRDHLHTNKRADTCGHWTDVCYIYKANSRLPHAPFLFYAATSICDLVLCVATIEKQRMPELLHLALNVCKHPDM